MPNSFPTNTFWNLMQFPLKPGAIFCRRSAGKMRNFTRAARAGAHVVKTIEEITGKDFDGDLDNVIKWLDENRDDKP